MWVMLHSGSRGIGNAIAEYFIQLARKDMERWMIQLPDRDLAYFPEGTEHFFDYVEAVHWAQEYAMQNRQAMLELVLDALQRHLPSFTVTTEAVNCHHNYVAKEHHYGADVWVTRKGAIRAREGVGREAPPRSGDGPASARRRFAPRRARDDRLYESPA